MTRNTCINMKIFTDYEINFGRWRNGGGEGVFHGRATARTDRGLRVGFSHLRTISKTGNAIKKYMWFNLVSITSP